MVLHLHTIKKKIKNKKFLKEIKSREVKMVLYLPSVKRKKLESRKVKVKMAMVMHLQSVKK